MVQDLEDAGVDLYITQLLRESDWYNLALGTAISWSPTTDVVEFGDQKMSARGARLSGPPAVIVRRPRTRDATCRGPSLPPHVPS
jgi:hypothetical protein